MTTLNIQNITADIEDFNNNSKKPQLGSVQVTVFFDYNNTHYGFSLQTKDTYDNCPSFNLEVYKYTDSYDDFVKAVADNENLELEDAQDLVEDFFTELSKKYEDMFETYIKQNYLVQDSNGMDANSLCNEMERIND